MRLSMRSVSSAAPFDAAADPSYWFYTLLSDDADGLARHLAAHGIASSKAHRRNDLHSVFADSRVALPGLDRFYARMLHHSMRLVGR
jgi:perosamine synthetase